MPFCLHYFDHDILIIVFILVMYCTTSYADSVILGEKQLLYSPNQFFAFGFMNYVLGVYHANQNGSLGTTFWSPGVTVPTGSVFVGQVDGNLFV